VGDEFAAGCARARGVDDIDSLAVSGDGRNVYVGSGFDGLLAAFATNSLGGLRQLSEKAGCLVGLHGSPTALFGSYGCRRTRLSDEVRALAPSRDGKHLYAASGIDEVGGIHVFSRRRAR